MVHAINSNDVIPFMWTNLMIVQSWFKMKQKASNFTLLQIKLNLMLEQMPTTSHKMSILWSVKFVDGSIVIIPSGWLKDSTLRNSCNLPSILREREREREIKNKIERWRMIYVSNANATTVQWLFKWNNFKKQHKCFICSLSLSLSLSLFFSSSPHYMYDLMGNMFNEIQTVIKIFKVIFVQEWKLKEKQTSYFLWMSIKVFALVFCLLQA